jgi:2-polyprenyl-6-methoxyphenol hydroxylase-like FAD-dependent oxidoreductase
MYPPLVLVIGAGPTGMTAAIELKRAGLDVRVIDKSDHLALHSQALVIQARTLEQLQRYGIAEETINRGRKLTDARMYSDGKQIVHFNLDRLPSRYPFALFLPQSETEEILNRHMQSLGVHAERKVELTGLSQSIGSVRATLRHPDGKSEEVNARWILGCDGAHSVVRTLIGTPFEGGGIDLSFFLGDCEVEGPDVPADEIAIHLRHGDVVFMGRLSEKWVRLIVALHAQNESNVPDLTIEQFQQAVDQVGVRLTIRSSLWMTPFSVSDRQARDYRIGNVFLAGDASHIHSPVGGQGMNTGMQDVANLAWKMAAVARGVSDKLLDSYGEEREEVGKALLKFTERGLKMATTTNPVLESLRDALAPLISSLRPIQKAALGFISETAITYRSSSIVQDHGGDGDLRAGDRMPDLVLLNNSAPTLLSNWTRAKHLVVMLNRDVAKVEPITCALPNAEIVAIRSADLDDVGKSELGTEPKLVILRPDGYIGFRGPLNRSQEFSEYVRQDALA